MSSSDETFINYGVQLLSPSFDFRATTRPSTIYKVYRIEKKRLVNLVKQVPGQRSRASQVIEVNEFKFDVSFDL